MTPKLLQLYSLRAQVEALIAMEEAELPQASGCPHPEDKRVPASNMGEEPQFWCNECKQMVKGQA